MATSYAKQFYTTLTDVISSGTYTGVGLPLSQYPMEGPPPGYVYGSIAFYEGSYATQQAFIEAMNANPLPAPAFWVGNGGFITSNEIWQCGGTLASGGTAELNIGKILAAAFNRGQIVDASNKVATSLSDVNGSCSCQTSGFYGSDTIYNAWAQLFHQVSANGLAYGFSYDDVCSQNPSKPATGQSGQTSSIRVTLGPFFTAGTS